MEQDKKKTDQNIGLDEEPRSLEATFEELEQIIEELEQEQISLEQAFDSYKKGVGLLKECHEKLDEVEKNVLILNENGELDEF